jgi:hypothetical protein
VIENLETDDIFSSPALIAQMMSDIAYVHISAISSRNLSISDVISAIPVIAISQSK